MPRLVSDRSGQAVADPLQKLVVSVAHRVTGLLSPESKLLYVGSRCHGFEGDAAAHIGDVVVL